MVAPPTSLAITGAWMRKSFRGGTADAGFKQMMTEQGKKAHDNYDHVADDPALRCMLQVQSGHVGYLAS